MSMQTHLQKIEPFVRNQTATTEAPRGDAMEESRKPALADLEQELNVDRDSGFKPVHPHLHQRSDANQLARKPYVRRPRPRAQIGCKSNCCIKVKS
jgi:hypothetical protein